MPARLRFLLVEDSPEDSELLLAHLKRAQIPLDSVRVETEGELRAALRDGVWDAVICDYNLPRMNALDAITLVRDLQPDLPCIVVSGSVGEERAVETMRLGASDFITKDNLSRLVPVLQRELRESDVRKERKRVDEALRKSEEALKQAQRLESIGQLAGGIAHDFNNIMATVLLQSEILAEDLNKNLSPENLSANMRQGIEQIRKSSERATRLTRQLLAFGRKQVVQYNVLSPNSVINDMEAMLTRLIETNIEIKINLAKDIHNIGIDPSHLEQIILNLAVNARDAMPRGGRLTVETSNIEVSEETAKMVGGQAGSYVLITVSDSGTGMSDEVKKHMFEPFYTTKEVGKGTGLGLSTVYGVVKQNKGLIFVESQPDQGTTIKIYFPATSESQADTKVLPLVTQAAPGGLTILVVEDEDNFRELIGEALSEHGYKILLAANGNEALATIRSHSGAIDLVLTDLIMPLMGGLELAKKAEELNPEIKFIFQSGYTEDTLLDGGVDPGRISFLAKPYSLKLLLNEIGKSFGSTRAAAQ